VVDVVMVKDVDVAETVVEDAAVVVAVVVAVGTAVAVVIVRMLVRVLRKIGTGLTKIRTSRRIRRITHRQVIKDLDLRSLILAPAMPLSVRLCFTMSLELGQL
jgi:hypothetical protein